MDSEGHDQPPNTTKHSSGSLVQSTWTAGEERTPSGSDKRKIRELSRMGRTNAPVYAVPAPMAQLSLNSYGLDTETLAIDPSISMVWSLLSERLAISSRISWRSNGGIRTEKKGQRCSDLYS